MQMCLPGTGDIVTTMAIGAEPNLALILIFSLNIWVILGQFLNFFLYQFPCCKIGIIIDYYKVFSDG